MLGVAGDYAERKTVASAGGSVEVLDVTVSGMSVEEVAALPAGAWKPWEKAGFAPAASDHSTWVRVKLTNPTAFVMQGVLENADNHADYAACYGATGDMLQRPLLAGEAVAAGRKEIWGRAVAFPLSVPAHDTLTVYVHLRDYFGTWLNLTWWPERGAAYAAQLRNILAEGCYFGLLLALIFYNAVLWTRLRFPDTGRYLLFLTSFTFYIFMARSSYLDLGFPLGSPWMEGIGMAALSLSGAFLAEFTRVFLDLEGVAPRADRAVRVVRNIMGGLAPMAVLAAWTGQGYLMQPFLIASMVTNIVLWVLAISAWRAGVKQARYFVLAFGVFLVGIAPSFAVMLPVVSLDLAARSIMIGSALQMLLLSVATADRFALLQRDKQRAQEQLLEETSKREAMQEAYADELEVEVRERTAELSAANADKDRMIAVIGHDLRSPLTGLTQLAEHLATRPTLERLEQFATETGRTGRQLLLLIEDLVLWAQLRAGRNHYGVSTVEDLVGPVVALHRGMADRQGVVLDTELPRDLKVSVDLVVTQTLVRNLLANAVKFARSSVRLVASGEGDFVRIAVIDDGAGLPEKIAAQFLAGEPSGWTEGGGLGLRLCREIGEAIPTKFRIETPSEGGTRISFTLPRVIN